MRTAVILIALLFATPAFAGRLVPVQKSAQKVAAQKSAPVAAQKASQKGAVQKGARRVRRIRLFGSRRARACAAGVCR
jgi:hypothetical protein